MQFRKMILKGNGNSATAQESMTIAAMENNEKYNEVICK